MTGDRYQVTDDRYQVTGIRHTGTVTPPCRFPAQGPNAIKYHRHGVVLNSPSDGFAAQA